jgi:hypothetical protein
MEKVPVREVVSRRNSRKTMKTSTGKSKARKQRLDRSKCKHCGKKWIEHKGVEPTCLLLQIALTTLEQIAFTPRNKGARQKALATELFIKAMLCGRTLK